MRLLLSLTIAAFSFTCSATPNHHRNIENDFALIFIYRAEQSASELNNRNASVDEQKVCKLSNNKYILVHVKPGKRGRHKNVRNRLLKKEPEPDIQPRSGANCFDLYYIRQSMTNQVLKWSRLPGQRYKTNKENIA